MLFCLGKQFPGDGEVLEDLACDDSCVGPETQAETEKLEGTSA